MTRLAIVLVSLAALAYGADHNTFKDCSRVEFCSALRGQGSQERYTVKSNTSDATSISVVLQSTLGAADLNVVLSALETDMFRLQISEVGSNRYQPKDSLDGEPVVSSPNIGVDGNSISLVVGDNQATITFSPFGITALKNDVLIFSFNGDRLIMDDSGNNKRFAFHISFPEAVQLYGIHEHAEHLALQNTNPGGMDPYRLRNLDVAGYELYSPMSLYGAVPVIYGHGIGNTAGFFLHNAAEQWFEITNGAGANTYVMVETGLLDLFILQGPSPTDVVRQYVGLTGVPHMPQLWTLGYHQSRWNYESQTDLKDVVANFDNFNFPMDAIWLDIEYTDGKKYFTWNPSNFSDPLEMQANVSATNRKIVTIIDPHIKVDSGYPVYTGALERDFFVKNADGSVFEGNCWPGLSSYIDFLNPEARSYYASWYSYENFPLTTPTIAGMWNDMNEPSVFDDSLEKTIPWDGVHFGGVSHRDMHNLYGLLHTVSTHQGLMDRDAGAVRPFILTRAHFSGSQRYTAIWTGDNTADWGFLGISYAECLNANLLGFAFCGADVGGFFGNPDTELLQRWYQAGVWLPFYRAHSTMGTDRREPYLYPDNIQRVLRDAMQLRYKHLPVFYTLFYEHIRTKDPIVRPLWYHYPSDSNVIPIDDQLLIGRDVMVRAVTQPGVASVWPYFPGGTEELWFSLNDNRIYSGTGWIEIPVTIDAIPVYYRRSSVIVRKDTVRQSSADMANDGYTLYVFLDQTNVAHGTVYLDDNTSFNYQNNLEYSYLSIDFVDTEMTITDIDPDSNGDAFLFNVENVVINRPARMPQDGQPGEYVSQVYTKDVNGNLLKDLKFGGNLKSTTVKLL